MKDASYRDILLFLAILSQTLILSCTNPTDKQQTTEESEAVIVELRNQNGHYSLYRDGKPYYIKGAGGSKYLDRLAAYGGNSVRTWSTNNAEQVLDEAYEYGLTVTMGLYVQPERHGFDYNDTAAVAKQLQAVKADILKYKDHPALLMWGIGNELNLNYTNPKVWEAVNDIAKMIHELDPNHPTATMLAGLNKKEVDAIKATCPEIDILAINVYGALPTIPDQIKALGWEGAYIITEWGPTGHWEVKETPWKAAIEETSSQKAAVYQSRYQASMAKDKEQCLGSYVFLWGQKQERTPTWYGLFTENGEETEVIDAMQYLWTGSWPQNRAPHIDSFTLAGKKAADIIYLQPGKAYPVQASVTDPDKNQLTYRWELLPESTDLGEGGDAESRPTALEGYVTGNATETTLKAPDKEGAYRLFIYAQDGKNKVATANIPFFVKP
ncbi:glycoside hydrolase family 2 TIM barrel-domain containing protein [Pontibacter sp. SGAir0037]|uniref:glycoside hydrolase family 2 TIM barrel-domain containing protein n=1 Tax=Pontibacter sp. SGAir0037 TaxID=2571030 RepID=UPI0010CD51D5|nr:glycoside hydrolase family 2 TIM barrel-domain containing protein [Pontibacter sp. SGAir0037]QCR23293.1 hypothetical protein C1N53_13730 [Pontibacter sp. SGAir0037]